jgi:hypothetical protein
MRTITLTAMLALLTATPCIRAAEDHHHDHHHDEIAKGPHGGQIVDSKEGFSFEVVVDEKRMARIVFLDKAHKPAALDGQSITGIAGERSAPVKLVFARGGGEDANVLVSDKPLPAGAHVPMILVIKTAPDSKAVTERFELHLH